MRQVEQSAPAAVSRRRASHVSVKLKKREHRVNKCKSAARRIARRRCQSLRVSRNYERRATIFGCLHSRVNGGARFYAFFDCFFPIEHLLPGWNRWSWEQRNLWAIFFSLCTLSIRASFFSWPITRSPSPINNRAQNAEVSRIEESRSKNKAVNISFTVLRRTAFNKKQGRQRHSTIFIKFKCLTLLKINILHFTIFIK